MSSEAQHVGAEPPDYNAMTPDAIRARIKYWTVCYLIAREDDNLYDADDLAYRDMMWLLAELAQAKLNNEKADAAITVLLKKHNDLLAERDSLKAQFIEIAHRTGAELTALSTELAAR